jgi:hypothetical protein
MGKDASRPAETKRLNAKETTGMTLNNKKS